MDTTKKSPTILSLCTGIRGIERGIERAIQGRCNVAAYVEIESFIIENLLAGMESGILAPSPIWSDLKTFPWERFHGKIHGIIGGYPCQPFSVAGNQLGEEDPRHLWPYIKNGIRAIRPIWCFFENVGGHLNIGYETVRRELQELGYRVEEGIFSAEEVGAPHKRERIFILAVLANSDRNGWPPHGRGSIARKNDQRRRTKRSKKFRFMRTNNSSGKLSENETGIEKLADSGLLRSLEHEEQTTGIKQSCFMDNPDSSSTEYKISTRRNAAAAAGSELANPCHFNWRLSESEGRQQNIETSRSSKINMADTKCNGLQRGWNKWGWKGSLGLYGRKKGVKALWPARPGQDQYDWEEQRTIKSGMGVTINGYNFREDLLRAAGNGVVEQTAELAWGTLWAKHFKN